MEEGGDIGFSVAIVLLMSVLVIALLGALYSVSSSTNEVGTSIVSSDIVTNKEKPKQDVVKAESKPVDKPSLSFFDYLDILGLITLIVNSLNFLRIRLKIRKKRLSPGV